MAGRISEGDKERVRDANRIEQVVGEYVALRPAGGGNLKGLCPFHDEKTPSFHVRPSHGTYHCFGCGEGGDVFSFIATVEHLTFVEALERLADRSGISITKVEGGSVNRTEPGTRARLVAANKAAAAFYAEQLTGDEAAPAREFLAVRGFDLAAAQSFGCGYAPSGWDRLTKALLAQGFSLAELVKAGLSRQGQRGPIDQFHRRLLWSIRDAAGDVVGFGARRLYDDDRIEAKYVNTAETPVYRKSHVLYGLDMAKRNIAKQRQAVVVEGYTDVMAMHLAGITTAVASCGTAFGEDHISVLRRFLLDGDVLAGEVIYTFDGDAAGQKAALKAFDSDQRFAANTSVAIAPDGMDPCELRQTRGDAAVRALVDSRIRLFQFAVRTTLTGYDLDSPEGQVAATRATVPLVARIRDKLLRERYARDLAGQLGSEPAEILAQVRAEVRSLAAKEQAQARQAAEVAAAAERAQQSSNSGNQATDQGLTEPIGRPSGDGVGRPVVRRPSPRDARTEVEREALKLALQHPDIVTGDYQRIDAAAFTEPAYMAVHEAITAAGGPPTEPVGPVFMSAVAEYLPAGVLRSLVTELAVEPPRYTGKESVSHYAGGVLARLAGRVAASDVAKLRSAVRRAEAAHDRGKLASLQADLQAVEAYRRALDQRANGESA